MPRLKWNLSDSTTIAGVVIPCDPQLDLGNASNAGCWDHAGIRADDARNRFIKRIAWPIYRAYYHALGIGYVYRKLGGYIRKHISVNDTILDVVCGSMPLQGLLPADCWYNAIDIACSEFQVRRMLRRKLLINFALASAKRIPVADEVVDVVLSAETLHWIPAVEQVLMEIRRVLKPNGKLICSIANGFQHKYDVLGVNRGMVYRWTFDDYVSFMLANGFHLVERSRVGYWVPLKRPRGLSQLHLPLTSASEAKSTHFCYVFQSRTS